MMSEHVKSGDVTITIPLLCVKKRKILLETMKFTNYPNSTGLKTIITKCSSKMCCIDARTNCYPKTQ